MLACALPAPALAYDEIQNWLGSYGQTLSDLTNPAEVLGTGAVSIQGVVDTIRYEAARIPKRGPSQFGTWPWSGDVACGGHRRRGTFAGRKQELYFPNRKGQQLHATLYAPSDAQLAALGIEAPLAAVVYSPGVLSAQPMYCWFGAGMANAGYVVMTYDVYGQGKSDGSARDNAPADLEDALAFLVSAANPFRSLIDPDRIGTAGHSMGAGAVQTVGSDGGRVKAISAQSDLGDRYTDTVPIQGQGADYESFILPTTPTFNTQPNEKLEGFNAARARGVETQEIVIESASHLAWSHVTGSYTSTWSEPVALHYSLAWFDRYLMGDLERSGLTGTQRLKLNLDAGGGHGLSRKYRSAYSLGADGECLDMLAGPC
jgi:hypothetical protein